MVGVLIDWIRGSLTLQCSSNVVRKARPRSKSLEDGEEVEGEGNDDENGDVVAQSKGSERNVAGNRRGKQNMGMLQRVSRARNPIVGHGELDQITHGY